MVFLNSLNHQQLFDIYFDQEEMKTWEVSRCLRFAMAFLVMHNMTWVHLYRALGTSFNAGRQVTLADPWLYIFN